MKHGNVRRAVRLGMPLEQVLVVTANFAGRIMMPYIMKVGLRQRRVRQTEDQEGDPQPTHAPVPG
jgi:hypothetical protein